MKLVLLKEANAILHSGPHYFTLFLFLRFCRTLLLWMNLLIISLVMAIALERAPLISLVMNTASCLIVCNFRHLNFEKPVFSPFNFQETDLKRLK